MLLPSLHFLMQFSSVNHDNSKYIINRTDLSLLTPERCYIYYLVCDSGTNHSTTFTGCLHLLLIPLHLLRYRIPKLLHASAEYYTSVNLCQC